MTDAGRNKQMELEGFEMEVNELASDLAHWRVPDDGKLVALKGKTLPDKK